MLRWTRCSRGGVRAGPSIEVDPRVTGPVVPPRGGDIATQPQPPLHRLPAPSSINRLAPAPGNTMPQTQTATTGGGESFAALFEESLKRSEMRAGEVITAEVVRVEHSFVVVNA